MTFVPQALIYLQWVRYAIEVVLIGRPYVVLNMDETSLSSVEDQGKGLRTCRRAARGAQTVRRGDVADRSNTKTTLIATVCDNRDLQPYLPQIVLARYTQNAAPPAHLKHECARSGEPLEYWHRTRGFATSDIIKEVGCSSSQYHSQFQPRSLDSSRVGLFPSALERRRGASAASPWHSRHCGTCKIDMALAGA